MKIDMDWTVLDIPGVKQSCYLAAATVARNYEGLVDGDDALQDSYLLVAANAQAVRAWSSNPLQGQAYVYRWVWSRLTDAARTERSRAQRSIPLERLGEA